MHTIKLLDISLVYDDETSEDELSHHFYPCLREWLKDDYHRRQMSEFLIDLGLRCRGKRSPFEEL